MVQEVLLVVVELGYVAGLFDDLVWDVLDGHPPPPWEGEHGS